MGRISKRAVDTLQPGNILWDDDVRGFGVRCQKHAKVYILKATVVGRQRWISIGEHGAPWTPDAARKEAQRLWGLIRSGVDPQRTRTVLQEEPNVADLCQRYLAEHARPFKKSRSAITDESNIRNHIIPLLGRVRVRELDHSRLEKFMRDVRDGTHADRSASRQTSKRGAPVVAGGPGIANRCLSLISKMLNLAERWEWRDLNSNPTRHVTRFKEKGRERYLSSAELTRLGAVLAESENDARENRYAIAAIKLLLLTGARLTEILTLRWDYIDVETGVARLPDSKTGYKHLYLNDAVLGALAQVPRTQDNPYVICGALPGSRLVNLQKIWTRIRARAGIDDVRLHDLRHSFASAAAASGLSLPLIGKLLGHARPETTARYAHLADDPVKLANNQVGDAISALLSKSAKS